MSLSSILGNNTAPAAAATSTTATAEAVPTTAAGQAWLNNMGLNAGVLQQKPAVTPAPPEPAITPAAQNWIANIQKSQPASVQANQIDPSIGPEASTITGKIDEQFKYTPERKKDLFDSIEDAAGDDGKLSSSEFRQLKFTLLNEPHKLGIDQNDRSEFNRALTYAYNNSVGGWGGGIFASAMTGNPESEA